MILTSLKLAHVRALEHAEFVFRPGFNLIVGVNGEGKSTVLDALRICLSRILPSISESRANAISFAPDDIRNGFPLLDVELSLAIGEQEFRFNRRQWRDNFSPDDLDNVEKLRRRILELRRVRGRRRDRLRDLDSAQSATDSDAFAPPRSELKEAAVEAGSAPHSVFFSTNRSVASDARGGRARAVGGTATAYAGALLPRPMYLSQLADWMRVQETLAREEPAAARHLDTLQSVVEAFLPDYGRLRGERSDHSRLLIERGKTVLDVKQLSDGERGVLALVLDLARRLSQANPSLSNPLADGQAIVLIDEIDLHLHPGWQRRIVAKLPKTFPSCQFIATTHSPQVIGEVEHDRIQIIADGEVYSPSHSFGVDSSRVLEEIMGVGSRTEEVALLLSQVARLIGKEEYGRAHGLLAQLVGILGDDDTEVTRISSLLEFLEDGE